MRLGRLPVLATVVPCANSNGAAKAAGYYVGMESPSLALHAST